MHDDTFHWDQLAGNEVLARLEQLDRAGSEPVSGFLDIHQWLPLLSRPGVIIDGGYPGAQFRRAGLGRAPQLAFYNVSCATLPPNARSAHGARVLLGKLAGPDRIGDLALGSHLAVVTAPEALANATGLTVQPTTAWSPPDIPPKRITAAGPRIDAVVAAAFQISRDEAQTAVQYGFVYKNLMQVEKRTTVVASGDELVFRAKGKLRIVQLGENLKSGRCWLEVVAQPA